jgi:hypothetical protein
MPSLGLVLNTHIPELPSYSVDHQVLEEFFQQNWSLLVATKRGMSDRQHEGRLDSHGNFSLRKDLTRHSECEVMKSLCL